MKYFVPLIVIGVGVGLLLIATSLDIPSTNSPEVTRPATSSEPTTETETPPPSWVQTRATSATGIRFSFSRPPVADFAQVQPHIFELTYVGPASEPATEITDGYLVSMVFATGTVDSYLATQTDVAQNGEMSTRTSIAGFPAQQFVTESELGTSVTHYVLNLGDEQLLDVGVTTAGAASSRYQNTVSNILDTLTVQTNINTGGADTGGATIPDLVRVSSPTEGAVISSPVTIEGEARGPWFFEADAPVVITDWDGRIIGEGYISAEGDWMTESFVPFSGEVSFELPTDGVSDRGAVILQKANPSGLPENDAALEITVTLQ
jgi:hypothetical protein